MHKYTKREAKKGTFKWKAKEDMTMEALDETNEIVSIVAFSKGKVYDMEVFNMYSYTTDSNITKGHTISKGFLHNHFEEVN